MTALRSLVFNLAFYAMTIAALIVGLPLLFAKPQTVKAFATAWARIAVWMLKVICGVRVDVRGLDHLPQGGCIIASKHQSFLDILVLIPLLPRFVFVMKRELLHIPLFGQFLARAGMIPIDRAKGRAVMGDLNSRVQAAVGQGLQLIMFPEGTRRTPGDEPSYKAGVSHLYSVAGVPCVPVALNTGVFWPRRQFMRRSGTVVVEFLPVIPPGLDRAAMLARLQEQIETASNALLPGGWSAADAARAAPAG